MLSWKEDLDKNETINCSGSLTQLQEIIDDMQPSAHIFAVGTYVCMVAEILMREVRPDSATQILQDVKSLGNFMSGVLKIQKSHVPKMVANALEKLTKDSHDMSCPETVLFPDGSRDMIVWCWYLQSSFYAVEFWESIYFFI